MQYQSSYMVENADKFSSQMKTRFETTKLVLQNDDEIVLLHNLNTNQDK